MDAFKTEIEYLRANWRMVGRPTLTIPITHAILSKYVSFQVKGPDHVELAGK